MGIRLKAVNYTEQIKIEGFNSEKVNFEHVYTNSSSNQSKSKNYNNTQTTKNVKYLGSGGKFNDNDSFLNRKRKYNP